MTYLLGIDVGTSSTKSEIFDINGTSVSIGQQEYPILNPQIGYVEEDPEVGWWYALRSTVREALKLSRINPRDIIGVCISGTNACVPVGKDGKALANAIMQLDNRSARYAEEMRKVAGDETVFKITGNRIAPGTFMAPSILWLKENLPRIVEEAYKFMVPTGFATMKLTDNYTIDWSRCSTTLLFDIERKKWSDELCSLLDIPVDKLPEPHISTDVVGEVTANAARETGLAKGTPVVAGCMDTVGAAVGSAILDLGDTFYTLGTLGRLCYCLDRPKFDMRFINICHAIEDRWLAMALMHGGGLTLRWFRDELGSYEVTEAQKAGRSPYSIFDEEAGRVQPGSRGVIFLPYLSGERSPIWDPNARGVFFGFTAQHKRGDLIRAIEEGVAYSLRHNLEVFEDMGFKIDKVRMGGGGAKSILWRQIIADVTEKRLEITANLTTETVGDALIAGIGVKAYNSIDRVREMVKVEQEVEPNNENYALYSKMFDIYKRLYYHLKDDFSEVSSVTK